MHYHPGVDLLQLTHCCGFHEINFLSLLCKFFTLVESFRVKDLFYLQYRIVVSSQLDPDGLHFLKDLLASVDEYLSFLSFERNDLRLGVFRFV